MFSSEKFIPCSELENNDKKYQQENKKSCDKGDIEDEHTEHAFSLMQIHSETDSIIEEDLEIMKNKNFKVKDIFHNSSEEDYEEVQKETKSLGKVGFNV